MTEEIEVEFKENRKLSRINATILEQKKQKEEDHNVIRVSDKESLKIVILSGYIGEIKRGRTYRK